MELYYNIAGLNVRMESFGRTVRQAEPYRINPTEHIDIQIHSIWPEKKLIYPEMPDDLGEYMATGIDFYKKLLFFTGMQVHSSAVVVDGRAYLFSADPGTGKSTHTSLWLERFGDRAFILNDDKPALRFENGQWMAYGTPWSGKDDISVNVGAPLAGIAMLHRGEKNEITPWSGPEALQALLKQINRPRETEYRIKLLENMDLLVRKVPIWKLTCNMSHDAVKVSFEAMSGHSID